jgi:hypothetical protein
MSCGRRALSANEREVLKVNNFSFVLQASRGKRAILSGQFGEQSGSMLRMS